MGRHRARAAEGGEVAVARLAQANGARSAHVFEIQHFNDLNEYIICRLWSQKIQKDQLPYWKATLPH